MIRGVVGVIVGYVVVVLTIFALLTLFWTVLGPSGAFAPGSWNTSLTWSCGALIVGFLAAVAGGCVCRAIAGGEKAPKIFAAIVVVLGILFALPTLFQAPSTDPRPDDIGMFAAMSKAATPAWVAFAQAFIGGVGVLVGARRRA